MSDKKPLFGVKDYEVRRDCDVWPTPDGKSRDVLEVEFLNERVYHSVWGDDYCVPGECIPQSRMFTHRYGDELPQEETDMEYLVVAHLTHEFFNPSHQDGKEPMKELA